MYKTFGIILIAGIITVSMLSLNRHPDSKLVEIGVDDWAVENVLSNLGGKAYNHTIKQADPEKVKIGEQLILNGRSKNHGKKGKLISIHFVCTDCHNLVKETENPANLSPEDRLDYAIKNKIKFLPGSTLWGIYNRRHWYNEDYVKKYGDIIKNAKDSLTQAVQVCAKYCSSGRFLENWELEAIMHYFKQQELKIRDLPLSLETKRQITNWKELEEDQRKALRETIESSFTTAFPATFMETMPRDNRKYGQGFDAERGEKIFESSCLYCHANKRVTYLHLEKNRITANMFWNNVTDYNDLTLYQIIRWGTYMKVGRKQYMPHYTKEKMSDRQIEDLVAYIRKLAKK